MFEQIFDDYKKLCDLGFRLMGRISVLNEAFYILFKNTVWIRKPIKPKKLGDLT